MNFLNRCNGTRGAAKLSNAAFKVFCQHSKAARDAFKAALASGELDPLGNFELGLRFLDDNSVLARIESAICDAEPLLASDVQGGGEAEFLADPQAWILDALRDCARADHHYTHEKDYGEF